MVTHTQINCLVFKFTPLKIFNIQLVRSEMTLEYKLFNQPHLFDQF